MSVHPIAAQSLLAERPSRVVPFFALSVAAHVGAIVVVLLFSWLLAPKVIDLDQKPIKASLVRLGKPRDEKLLPRKEEPKPPPPPEKVEVPVPAPAPAPPSKAIPIPDKDAKKPSAKQDLFKALQSASKQAEPEEGKEDGDPNGDAAKEEGERYYAIISQAVRRYYDVANVIPEAERRTLKAQVAMRVGGGGELTDAKLSKPSGNELFDEAVISAVKKAAPFPPPPEHMKKVMAGGVTLVFSP